MNVPLTPIRRDTVVVESGGHVVLRYRADNPGTWYVASTSCNDIMLMVGFLQDLPLSYGMARAFRTRGDDD